MAEVLLKFEATLAGPNGRSYEANACGRPLEGGKRWEGWIEFVPGDDSPVLRTAEETVQPNRDALVYWATGLSVTYLEGALDRALEPPPAVPVPTEAVESVYDEPAPPVVHVSSSAGSSVRPHGVLDPFHVYSQGEDLLRRELTALAPPHLINIIREHSLVQEQDLDLTQMSRAGLVDLIVAAVRKQAG
jgi:hypothetical protein